MPHKRAKRSVREKTRMQNDLDPGARTKNALSNEEIPKGAARILNAAKIQEEWRKKRKLGSGDDGPENLPKKKRKTAGEGNAGQSSKNGKGTAMKILPGESLAHFNRRVEESMRPLVRDAIQASATVTRRTKKEEEALREAEKAEKAAKHKAASQSKKQSSKGEKGPDSEDESDSPEPDAAKHKAPSKPTRDREKPTEFAGLKTSAPRRLNDIVQAPPEIKKLPRGAKPTKAAKVEGAAGAKTLREGVMSMAQKAMLEQERERAIKAYREMKKRHGGV